MFTYQISYLLRNLKELQRKGKNKITEGELEKEVTKRSIISYTPDKKN